MGAVSSHFRLSSQGHQVASAVRLCSRHVTLVALRDDGGYHLYYTYTSGHILRSVSLLWTIRRYRKMNDKTQSRNSRSCCDSCSRHYLSVLFLVGVGFGELRGDLQVLFFFFQMQMWRICLIDMVGSLSLSRLCPKIRRLYLNRTVYFGIERFLCKVENCS